ncbi:chromosomal replication initiator protein DnaA, partial [Arcobacteraceae bacterium]|nr:chromosomal replication initiator protein DnaA [Arcobacteraceae bacterium]
MNTKEFLNKLKPLILNKDFKSYALQLSLNQNKSDDTTVIFEVPNQFIAKYIKTRFLNEIESVLETHFHINPDIFIEVATNISKRVAKKDTKLEPKKTANNTTLNPFFTFENFVVGKSNEMAYKTANFVSLNEGMQYNPLFIYGGTGLGKTHLLQAIGNEAINNGKTVIYVTSEEFMNTFIFSLKKNNMQHFRDIYRKCDLLLIDDVQFFSGKESTQEEFFHTFNELHSLNKQVVMTADKIPSQIAGLEDRLRSRFLSGLTTKVEMPKLETKIAIIKTKCDLNKIQIDEEIVNFIATNFNNSIREIEGALVNLDAHSKIMQRSLNINQAKEVLADHLFQKQKEITMTKIIETVARELNIKPSTIKTKRTPCAVEAKRVIIYLAKELLHNNSFEIANELGMKNRSTV